MSEEKKYRLLIADDEMIERAVLVKLLGKRLGEQCEIFQAQNGREAIALHRDEEIEIAILDIEMPGINGIGAAEKIRETDKNCSIIFLTAFDEFAYAKKAITVRALDYLLKPYEEKELFLVLEEAMRIAEQNRNSGVPSDASSDLEPIGAQLEAEMHAQMEADEARDALRGGEPPELIEAARLSRVMELIADYIREHYMYDLSMQELARTMNYSEAYFCKLFKQFFGQNFTSYLTEYRVREAKKMLEQPTVNVKDVGKAVGYGDGNYFAKVFKRMTGQSPSEYRQEIFTGNMHKEKRTEG
ncbi:MAG: response regulator [Lachnospiraceae bacterium]|nr:response regulator [Lachnospiraceae bacterium]